MNHRSDLSTVFLPREFLPAAADGEQIQLEMQVVEARAFLDRMKSAAVAQRMRFLSCLVLVMIALLSQALDNVFCTIVVNATKDDDCNMSESCQTVQHLIRIWYREIPEVFPLVSSACCTCGRPPGFCNRQSMLFSTAPSPAAFHFPIAHPFFFLLYYEPRQTSIKSFTQLSDSCDLRAGLPFVGMPRFIACHTAIWLIIVLKKRNPKIFSRVYSQYPRTS
jgi:hypothetical protein